MSVESTTQSVGRRTHTELRRERLVFWPTRPESGTGASPLDDGQCCSASASTAVLGSLTTLGVQVSDSRNVDQLI